MPEEDRGVELSLSPEEARALHAFLEEKLEGGRDAHLERVYRLLGWRVLASSEGHTSGLTRRLAEIARNSGSLAEFEAERDRELGPILDGLERGENRDP